MPDIAFSLAADLAPDRLDMLGRDLMRDVDRIGALTRPVVTMGGEGERGVIAAVGTFLIDSLLNNKTAAALLEVIKAYIAREKSLRISVIRPDGTKIEIDAKNVSSVAVAEFLGAVQSITG
jgi:hypothetical protein